MGRPKGSKNVKAEAEPKPAVNAGAATSKAEAVRQALSAGMDTPGDIAAFAKSNFGLDIPKPQASAYKAQIKARESKVKATRGRKPRAAVDDYLAPPPKIVATGEGDLLDAMEKMKPLVASLGVERIKRIAELLG
jgi:hypothetical protein